MHTSRPPLSSRQLRAFAALARAGGFTQVAKEMFPTQLAVSHAMDALEESGGCRLLGMLRKKEALTKEGEQREASSVLKSSRRLLRGGVLPPYLRSALACGRSALNLWMHGVKVCLSQQFSFLPHKCDQSQRPPAKPEA